jgi:hypothetical protein
VVEPILTLAGRWQVYSQALHQGMQAAQQLGDQVSQAYFAHQQGTLALCQDQLPAAQQHLQHALELRRRLGDRRGAERTQHNLKVLQPTPPPSPPPPRRRRWLIPALPSVGRPGRRLGSLIPALPSVGRDVFPPVVDENVQFTVYRPGAVQPGVWYPMLTFAHLAERRDQVTALADRALGDKAWAYGSPTSDARGAIPKASELTFVPDMVGVEFNPPRRVFRWLEDIHKEEFRLRADSRLNGQVSYGRLTVFLGAFILADVDLVIRIDESAEEPPTPTILTSAAAQGPSPRLLGVLEPANGSPYRRIFPSYSHRDTQIVKQAERLGAALGDVYLRDRTTLHSGEEWNAGLLKLIDKADVFQLFWSSNSMRSEYVRQEWEHAVTLARPNFIRPTYWEEPMPQSEHPLLPPSSLSRLHFHLLVLPRRLSRASLVMLVSVLVSVCILIVLLLWSR